MSSAFSGKMANKASRTFQTMIQTLRLSKFLSSPTMDPKKMSALKMT